MRGYVGKRTDVDKCSHSYGTVHSEVATRVPHGQRARPSRQPVPKIITSTDSARAAKPREQDDLQEISPNDSISQIIVKKTIDSTRISKRQVPRPSGPRPVDRQPMSPAPLTRKLLQRADGMRRGAKSDSDDESQAPIDPRDLLPRINYGKFVLKRAGARRNHKYRHSLFDDVEDVEDFESIGNVPGTQSSQEQLTDSRIRVLETRLAKVTHEFAKLRTTNSKFERDIKRLEQKNHEFELERETRNLAVRRLKDRARKMSDSWAELVGSQL